MSTGSRGDLPRWPDAAWPGAAVGRRVTVRRLSGGTGPTGGPAFHDVVGVLERVVDSPTPAWHVRTRQGELVEVDPTLVVAAKVVPDAPARRRSASAVGVDELERIAAEGWQPLEHASVGDWVLRAAAGYSGRANSVLPLGDPARPLDDALHAISAWYQERGLPPKIQVALPLLAELDAALERRGWTCSPPVLVQVVDLAVLRRAASPSGGAGGHTGSLTVTVDTVPDPAWLAAFRYGDQPLPASAVGIMTRADHPVFVALRGDDGTPLAISRGAITPRWLGITAVEVTESWRRRGFGRRVVAALADYAAGHGVRHVYLQVTEDNAAARGLYEQLGFSTHHRYVYRLAP